MCTPGQLSVERHDRACSLILIPCPAMILLLPTGRHPCGAAAPDLLRKNAAGRPHAGQLQHDQRVHSAPVTAAVRRVRPSFHCLSL